jgi:hypothetical protein
MEFRINCRLGYEIAGSASFLFNVAAVRNSLQQIVTEEFQVAGAESCQELLVGYRRFHRVVAQPGQLELTYETVVDVDPEILQPQSLNIPLLHDLPPESLVFSAEDLLICWAARLAHLQAIRLRGPGDPYQLSQEIAFAREMSSC